MREPRKLPKQDKPWLFFDIDGVLTRHAEPGEDQGLNPLCVRTFEQVVRTSDCNLIMSSAWRYMGHGPDSVFSQCLAMVSVDSGCTIMSSVIDALPIEPKGKCVQRDELIRDYVKECGLSCERWVAVDDLADIEKLGAGHFLRTDGSVGLQPTDSRRLICLLKYGFEHSDYIE
jgi:hypothetical protein